MNEFHRQQQSLKRIVAPNIRRRISPTLETHPTSESLTCCPNRAKPLIGDQRYYGETTARLRRDYGGGLRRDCRPIRCNRPGVAVACDSHTLPSTAVETGQNRRLELEPCASWVVHFWPPRGCGGGNEEGFASSHLCRSARHHRCRLISQRATRRHSAAKPQPKVAEQRALG